MASDQHCLASVEKGSPNPNHDGVMVERTDTANSDGRGGVRVRECERVCACVHACVRDVFAICDNDILPMLIMIIINIIYLIIRRCARTGAFPGAFCVPNSVALASPTLWGVQWAIH